MPGFGKIAVVGAGSVGGYLGGILALAGEDVTFIARGATLEGLQSGFTLIDRSGTRHAVKAKAAAMESAGAFDLVILALKAQQIGGVLAHLPRLLNADTPIVAVQNGIPWWYFHKSGGAFEGRRIEAVDADGSISKTIEGRRIVGGVIYVAATVVKPGVVHATETNRMVVGEPDGSLSARTTALADMFTRAGFKTTASADIRTDIWTKLWGNSVFNPVSALTRAGLADIANDPGTRPVVAAAMAEVEQVALRFGVRMPMSIIQRIDVAASLGNHKTSMLQDIEAGRPPEIGANVAAVIELARLAGQPTPTLDAIHTCTRLLAQATTRATA
jgi:2-dehydropantoate 2-reductase